ncbi:MAG: hypothetical protein V3R67_07835 [Thermodesulfobacteriota bacterium]
MAKSLDEFTVILPTRDELLNIHNFLESVPNSMPSIVIDVRHVTTPYKTLNITTV